MKLNNREENRVRNGIDEEGTSCETIIGLIDLYGDLVIEK